MYFRIKLRTVLPVQPADLDPNKSLKEVLLRLARNYFEASAVPEIGFIIAILDIEPLGAGDIKLRDPRVYFKVILDTLVYKPVKDEVLIGKVENLTDSSIYINVGSFDAILPINQIGEGRYRYIAKSDIIKGLRTREVIRKGEWVRATVTRFRYIAPAEIRPLIRESGAVAPTRILAPKTEVSIVLRCKDEGLGPEKRIERFRKEISTE